ncbi:uncharacterized protein [Ptychodera flava]|uniref:uncharacterized protein isoform X2 n=1 Tax=Ptychodera flava TaxID=63121 RepID=UPI00396A94B9
MVVTLEAAKEKVDGLKDIYRHHRLPLIFAAVALFSFVGTSVYVIGLSQTHIEALGPAQRSVLQYHVDESPDDSASVPSLGVGVAPQFEDEGSRRRSFLQSELGRRLQNIIIRLEREKENITDIYHQMDIERRCLRRAIVNWGNVDNLKKGLKTVIKTGRSFRIGIMGGSVSVVNIYPKVLQTSLQRILSERVDVLNAAIGATDSQYFAYCLKNHLNVNQLDLILWEFAVNDYLKGVSPSAQEEITRELLEVPARPQLLYVNFLYGTQISQGSCDNSEDVGGRELSFHYNVPSVSLKEAVCPKVKAKKAKDLVAGDNKNHLSSKAHLLMELFLRHFMVNVITNVTWEMLDESVHPDKYRLADVDSDEPPPLPQPLFADTRITRPRCWSALLPQHSLSEYLWPIRAAVGWNKVTVDTNSPDHKQVWVGNLNGSVIRFPIEIEPYRNLTSKIAVSTFTCNECGAVRVIVDNDFARAATVYGKSKFRVTWPTVVATDIPPGSHNITIKCLSDDPFQLAAITTAYDITAPVGFF